MGKQGEQLMLGSATKFDAQMSVAAAQAGIFNDQFTDNSNKVLLSTGAGALGAKAAAITTGNGDVAIYKVHNTAGYKPVIVTESLQHQLPVRLAVLQPWRLRRLHRP